MQGHSAESSLISKKRDEKMEEINRLQAELQREKARNDVSAVNRKLERLQQEREDQDKTIKVLNKSIETFKIRMQKYESEKVTLTENTTIAKKQDEFGAQALRSELETLKNKYKLVEDSRNQRNEEVRSLKVRVADLEATDAQNKTERAELVA